jgi:glycosyltransferase involved in cell wall biosynthesis
MSATAAMTWHAELEGGPARRAPGGHLTLRGWCLVEGDATPPPVRLSIADEVFPATARVDRPDVAARFPQHPAAARCGFELTARPPAGVHLARLEARSPAGDWHAIKTFSLRVDPPPFAAALEHPAGTDPITRRVHVEGWALHPRGELRELILRYGHQSIPCELGRARTDVPALHPEAPHATHAGFKTSTILSAGHGPLRLRGRLANGSVAVAHLNRTVDIAGDENHGPELDLHASRLPLSGYAQRPPAPATPTDHPRNLLFVLYGNFASNSALHVCALANELGAAGHDCVISVPRDVETVAQQAAPRFRACLHDEAIATGGGFRDGRGPDLIHAWTTREVVRCTTEAIRQRHGGRLVIHLEDNEQEIVAQTLGRSIASLAAAPANELAELITPGLTHPRHGPAWLATAAGVTLIMDRLGELVPAHVPTATFWPAADARYFFPRDIPRDFRRQLDPRPDATWLFYHGNVHAANAREMRELYTAVADLNDRGHPCILLRTGVNQVDFPAALAARVRPHVIELGLIPHHRHLPPLMALADVFVQPGEADAFNAYRFPSKLPEFFALGRPVILPRTNLGEHLRHGEEAYVLDRADAAGIAAAILTLRGDPALTARLSAGATAFAARHFNWSRAAATLANFYTRLTASRS